MMNQPKAFCSFFPWLRQRIAGESLFVQANPGHRVEFDFHPAMILKSQATRALSFNVAIELLIPVIAALGFLCAGVINIDTQHGPHFRRRSVVSLSPPSAETGRDVKKMLPALEDLADCYGSSLRSSRIVLLVVGFSHRL